MPAEDPKLPTEAEMAARQLSSNLDIALNMLRNLTVHCVMYVPATQLGEGQKAYLHREIVKLEKLYAPKEATI